MEGVGGLFVFWEFLLSVILFKKKRPVCFCKELHMLNLGLGLFYVACPVKSEYFWNHPLTPNITYTVFLLVFHTGTELLVFHTGTELLLHACTSIINVSIKLLYYEAD